MLPFDNENFGSGDARIQKLQITRKNIQVYFYNFERKDWGFCKWNETDQRYSYMV